MTLAPGTTLAAYAIERLLGRGGMGEVYLATHAGLGRRVALKLLAPELAADPGFRERFIAESRLAASLDHPHLVPIYEAGEADGRLFLAMRYVEGDDLGGLIAAGGRLAPDRAVGLLAGIAAALDAAHDRGLVHRDVKPANILVARTARGAEHAYLGDFGLTRELGSDAGFTRTGQLVGSVDYVAPEQIEGRPTGAAADVYSLACVLYACLAGRPPYPRETEVATLWAHVQAEPPRPGAVDPALARFDPVIARGMAKDPAERYPTAGELLAAAGAAAGEAEPGPGARAREAARPPASPPAAAAVRGNLPVQLSTFVGRATELDDLARLLPVARLVTLTGPGGTGKTRLALQAAARLAPAFPDGAHIVELASITDPSLVPSQVASVLDVPEAEGESIEASLGRFVEGRQLLLLLDNLEQLPDIGPFVSRLLAGSQSIHILATSRVPLHVRGEVEYAVSPLGVPDPHAPQTADEVGRSDAVALFMDRASATRADFRVTDQNAPAIAAITTRVDGLPLAIELAAARVKLLSPSQILSRLGDRLGLLAGGAADLPERQRTLRATIAWSYELLDEPAKVLFQRLAVFDGGLTFAAAEAVAAGESDRDLLETMTALVDGSLLRPIATADDEPRFAMLETIREFAGERLSASGEVKVIAGRHFDYFFEMGRRFEEELGTTDLGTWLHRLDADRPNLVAAIQWGISAGDVSRAARLIESLRDYTRARGRTTEARLLIATLLAQPELPDAQRATLLHEAAVLAVRQGDLDAVDRLAREALAFARQLGDARNAVGAAHLLAISAAERGDAAAEAQLISEMLDAAERSNNPRMEILARSHVALRSLRLGEFNQAAAHYDDLLTLMGEVEVMSESVSATYFNRGLAELHAGRLSDAAASFAASAEIGRSMEDPDLLGYALEGYAALASTLGRHGLAATLQGAADTALNEAGSTLELFEADMSTRTAAAARSALGDAAYDAERASGAALPTSDALDLAIALGQELATARPAERRR